MLLARLFESLPLVCPNCGADMRIIAFVTEAAPVQRCNVVVRQDADGDVQVMFMDPMTVLSLVDNPKVPALATDVRARLDRVLEAVKG
jgi:hypothetical protein